MSRDFEPTVWPETIAEAKRIADEGVFLECSGEAMDDPSNHGVNQCVGCPGYTTRPGGDWCGAVYQPRVRRHVP